MSFTATEYGFWTMRQDSEADGIQSESFFVVPRSDAPAPLRWVSTTEGGGTSADSRAAMKVAAPKAQSITVPRIAGPPVFARFG
jgi:hypothetical protein